MPYTQRASEAMVVMLRASGDPSRWIPAVRRHVSALDRNIPIRSLRPFNEWLSASLARRRFSTLLLSLFAALAMLLAAVGIYGVLNYWVCVRQKEIAIRQALGARRSTILHWAGTHAARLAGLGIVIGGLGAWAASRWMESLVFGIPAKDPRVLLAAGAAVLGIAVLAAGAPLWRATRVDAVRSLHES
jgi:putative ABC transport system permease protein